LELFPRKTVEIHLWIDNENEKQDVFALLWLRKLEQVLVQFLWLLLRVKSCGYIVVLRGSGEKTLKHMTVGAWIWNLNYVSFFSSFLFFFSFLFFLNFVKIIYPKLKIILKKFFYNKTWYHSIIISFLF
jgi:hypothetical protein